MYSVIYVANYLDISTRTVTSHIRQEKLKASFINDQYLISRKDLEEYESNEFNNKTKRNNQNLTLKQFNDLENFIIKIKAGLSLKELAEEYPKLELKIPSLEAYLKYERNVNIIKAKKEGMKLEDIAAKFKLSKCSIEKIVYKKDYNNQNNHIPTLVNDETNIKALNE